MLVVEDDLEVRETLDDFLTDEGFRIVTARNGKDALAQLRAGLRPAAILLDLLMPEMDGPSFLEVVRSYLRLETLPVVILTGLADSPMIERAQHLKVNAVLMKGKVTPDDIQKALEEAVGRAPG